MNASVHTSGRAQVGLMLSLLADVVVASGPSVLHGEAQSEDVRPRTRFVRA